MDSGRPRLTKPPAPAEKGRGASGTAKVDVNSREAAGNSLTDPRLAEIVRFLARQSAEEFCAQARKRAVRKKKHKA